jgi:putative DNA-invertase from lambdoid prophage Rac
MVGVFSEFERSMISERVKLGLNRAKNQGKILGRPRKLDDTEINKIREMIGYGYSIGEIATMFGVSKMTVSRIKTNLLKKP